MTFTAEFHVDVEVPDSLTDATMDEIRDFTDQLAESGSRQFLEDRDIDPANIKGVELYLRWDDEVSHAWLRYMFEVEVPKRVWQSLNPDARLGGDADG